MRKINISCSLLTVKITPNHTGKTKNKNIRSNMNAKITDIYGKTSPVLYKLLKKNSTFSACFFFFDLLYEQHIE